VNLLAGICHSIVNMPGKEEWFNVMLRVRYAHKKRGGIKPPLFFIEKRTN
jgi:hypothetical protein